MMSLVLSSWCSLVLSLSLSLSIWLSFLKGDIIGISAAAGKEDGFLLRTTPLSLSLSISLSAWLSLSFFNDGIIGISAAGKEDCGFGSWLISSRIAAMRLLFDSSSLIVSSTSAMNFFLRARVVWACTRFRSCLILPIWKSVSLLFSPSSSIQVFVFKSTFPSPPMVKSFPSIVREKEALALRLSLILLLPCPPPDNAKEASPVLL
mmetsp:Transcript_9650/g.18971  ORF Transcript_9650/g.18971 Transcript_9650/m.18971 type:complete len:206 (+) Transcript_9650:251-868(+)